jgi:enterochelin esterase-like enzyme
MLNRQEAGWIRQQLPLIAAALFIIFFLAGCNPSSPGSTTTLQASFPTTTITQNAEQTSKPSPTLTTAPTSTATQKPTCAAQAGTVNEVSLDTTLMYTQFQFLVYLPPCYQQETGRNYPLLILFHGIYDTQEQWLRIGAVETANRLIISGEVDPFIIVMPYDPNPRGPEGTPFDEIFLQELLPYLKDNYRISDDADLWALGGVSRGAGWAIHFGFLHPELFGAIGAFSPIIFWEDSPELGTWLEAIPAGKNPRISLDIGNMDPNSEGYKKLEAILTQEGIPFEASEFPGNHSDDYWRSRVESYLRWFTAGW